ncbi:hypothetical protein [Streptomyces sp. NPDC056061]|uniref:hypothetical protein n=1 Tax=Streptomyces sp. NPDC056061 TaxID=3345700 RepID=UPI0035D9E019
MRANLSRAGRARSPTGHHHAAFDIDLKGVGPCRFHHGVPVPRCEYAPAGQHQYLGLGCVRIERGDSGIARYEFFLEVARCRQLRASLDEWGTTQRAAFAGELRGAGSADPEADAADLLTVINGLLLEQLALPIDDFESVRLRPAVARFFPKG